MLIKRSNELQHNKEKCTVYVENYNKNLQNERKYHENFKKFRIIIEQNSLIITKQHSH